MATSAELKNKYLDTFKDIWGPDQIIEELQDLNLDTFKDIWGPARYLEMTSYFLIFRYLQGYMGTCSNTIAAISCSRFRYLQGYMGTDMK